MALEALAAAVSWLPHLVVSRPGTDSDGIVIVLTRSQPADGCRSVDACASLKVARELQFGHTIETLPWAARRYCVGGRGVRQDHQGAG
jgi:hypothetical protein